jgi:hypothetical protein
MPALAQAVSFKVLGQGQLKNWILGGRTALGNYGGQAKGLREENNITSGISGTLETSDNLTEGVEKKRCEKRGCIARSFSEIQRMITVEYGRANK